MTIHLINNYITNAKNLRISSSKLNKNDPEVLKIRVNLLEDLYIKANDYKKSVSSNKKIQNKLLKLEKELISSLKILIEKVVGFCSQETQHRLFERISEASKEFAQGSPNKERGKNSSA